MSSPLYSKVQLSTDNADSIRLLTVGQNVDDGDSQVALSDDDLFDVECNDETIKVYYNLYHALFRLSQYPYNQRYFWIDAICIDQRNVEEQNHQVHMMSRIFSTAEQVIIWLGPEDEHSVNAFTLIDALCTLTDDQRRSINPYNLNRLEIIDTFPPPVHEKSFWLSLAHLFRRNWFFRAWVIQEVLLSKSLIVLCGDDSLPWENIITISEYLATSPWNTAFRDPEFLDLGMTLPRHGGPAKLAAAQRSLRKESESVLLYSLIRARQSYCQDLRDKVFSLYGIAVAHAPNTVTVPKADYKLELQRAYTEAAVHILENYNDLHILAHAEGDQFRNIANLPSWVPDWSVTDEIGLGVTGYKRFQAAGDLLRHVEVSQPSRTLHLKAGRIARIAICGESKRIAEKTGAVPGWIDILRNLAVTYFNGESSVESFWRTLICNTCPDRITCPAPDIMRRSFESWIVDRAKRSSAIKDSNHWGVLAGLCRSRDRLYLPSQYLSETISLNNHSDSNNLRGESLSLSHESTSFGWAFSCRLRLRLFLTEDGFIGLGSESLIKGDTIWIVPGSRVPLILRERSKSSIKECSKYELVGGTYLHGFMHGEALQGIPCDDGRKPLDFQMIEIE